MYVKGILGSVSVFICYFLLIVSLSSLILGNTVKKETIFKRFMIYLMFGNFYISSIVFVLGYMNQFNRLNLIVSIVITSTLIWLVLNKKGLKEKTLNLRETFDKVVMGMYGTRLLLWRTGKQMISRTKRFFYELFAHKKLEWAIFIPIIGYNLYQYGINNIEYLTYMSPDEEVHLYWVQSLIGGNMFPSGVYPHIFHNIIGAISEVFNLDALITLKYFAPTACLLIMTMLYFGLRKIFSTKYPALFGLMIYSLINIFGEQVTYRFQFAIPQEYAMIMLMPMGIFLIDYIRDKKIVDLTFFGISLSLMLGIHFYTGIIGLVMVFSIGIIYLYKIIKDKIFLKLFIAGLLSIIVAIGPLGVGLMVGHEMEQSMNWATEVIQGDIYKEDIVPESLTWDRFMQNANEDMTKHVVLNINVFYIFLGSMLTVLLFNLVLKMLKKDDAKSTYQIIFVLNSSLLLFLMLLRSLQLPTIMETKRVAIFFAYFSPILMGIPLEIIDRIFKNRKIKKTIPFISVGAMVISLVFVIGKDYVRPISPFYYFQTTGTMLADISIIEEYEDYTWTAVSPVNNISAVLNHGYHYELDDFILVQENWSKEKQLRIPTEYVFIYIEKRPIIKYGSRSYRDKLDPKNRKMVTEEDALKELTVGGEHRHYQKERHILMAKAYYWAQEYQKYFPKEMTVYYEDEELIVYKIKQNKYALNNFTIDYGMNSR